MTNYLLYSAFLSSKFGDDDIEIYAESYKKGLSMAKKASRIAGKKLVGFRGTRHRLQHKKGVFYSRQQRYVDQQIV